MLSRLRVAYCSGSGVLLDQVTSVTISGVYIKKVLANGGGTFVVTGVSTQPLGQKSGNILKFNGTGGIEFDIPERGVYMDSQCSVSAPSSASSITVFYA